jgi:hypothetical protein
MGSSESKQERDEVIIEEDEEGSCGIGTASLLGKPINPGMPPETPKFDPLIFLSLCASYPQS